MVIDQSNIQQFLWDVGNHTVAWSVEREGSRTIIRHMMHDDGSSYSLTMKDSEWKGFNEEVDIRSLQPWETDIEDTIVGVIYDWSNKVSEGFY